MKRILTANDGFGRKGDEVEMESEKFGLATVVRISDGKRLAVFSENLASPEAIFTDDLFGKQSNG